MPLRCGAVSFGRQLDVSYLGQVNVSILEEVYPKFAYHSLHPQSAILHSLKEGWAADLS
jgi:hypothetical protein